MKAMVDMNDQLDGWAATFLAGGLDALQQSTSSGERRDGRVRES